MSTLPKIYDMEKSCFCGERTYEQATKELRAMMAEIKSNPENYNSPEKVMDFIPSAEQKLKTIDEAISRITEAKWKAKK